MSRSSLSGRFGTADSQFVHPHRDNRPNSQLVTVQINHSSANESLLSGRDVDQSHDSRMRTSGKDGKLTEIFIQGNKDTSFTVGKPQNRFVARILVPIASPDDIVASGLEVGPCTTPDTSVQQNPHWEAASTINGSTRSWATSLLA